MANEEVPFEDLPPVEKPRLPDPQQFVQQPEPKLPPGIAQIADALGIPDRGLTPEPLTEEEGGIAEPERDVIAPGVGYYADVFGTTPQQLQETLERRVRGAARWSGEALLHVVAAIGVALGGPSNAAAPWNTWLRQQAQKRYPNEIVTPDVALRGLWRNAINDDAFDELLKRQGYNDSQQSLFKASARSLLPVAEAITLWRRGYMDDKAVRASIMKHGFSRNVTERVLTSSEVIPSVQDIILQLVREVFTPELREFLTLDEDYPPDADAQFARLGVSPKTARDYWAAHWRLPSFGQGAQMFFRDELDLDELKKLLRTLDYSKYWRDKLIKIAHKLLTRVDTRRIHALGKLEDHELKARYLKLGYDDDNAQLMADFTIAFNAAPPEEEVAETRKLTRAQILRFHDNLDMPEGTAETMLVNLGYTQKDAKAMIQLRDIKAAEDEEDDKIELVRRKFANGVTNYTEAISELNALDLAPTRTAIIAEKMERVRQGNIKMPTLSVLGKMLKKAIITPDIYRAQLERIGYPDVWAERYMELIGTEVEEEMDELELD